MIKWGSGGVAQLVRACVLYTQRPWFESRHPYHETTNDRRSFFCASAQKRGEASVVLGKASKRSDLQSKTLERWPTKKIRAWPSA